MNGGISFILIRQFCLASKKFGKFSTFSKSPTRVMQVGAFLECELNMNVLDSILKGVDPSAVEGRELS